MLLLKLLIARNLLLGAQNPFGALVLVNGELSILHQMPNHKHSPMSSLYQQHAKPQTFPYVRPLSAAGRPANLVRVYRLKGRTNNILIIKQVNACSDGMSDKNYSYSATFILGNRVLDGCAEKK